MRDLPFSVSPEAAVYIEESLRRGDAVPGCAGLYPALCQCPSFVFRDSHGTIESQFRGESWNIGYHRPEVATAKGFVSVPLCGRTVWIRPDHLSDLTGKRLVMELVGVGVPSPADKMERMLRAV